MCFTLWTKLLAIWHHQLCRSYINSSRISMILTFRKCDYDYHQIITISFAQYARFTMYSAQAMEFVAQTIEATGSSSVVHDPSQHSVRHLLLNKHHGSKSTESLRRGKGQPRTRWRTKEIRVRQTKRATLREGRGSPWRKDCEDPFVGWIFINTIFDTLLRKR